MPTVSLQPNETNSKDTYIESANPTTNFGTSTIIYTGGAGVPAHGLIQFDLSSIPAGSVINSATLTMIVTGGEASSRTMSLHRSLVDWNESQATWQQRVTGTAWGANGGLSGTDYSSSAFASGSAPASGTWTINVASEVNAIVNLGVTNRGWWIIKNTGSLNKEFASSSHATAANRPKLEVTYQLPFLIGVSAGTSTVTGTGIRVGYLRANIAGTSTATATGVSNEYVEGSTQGAATAQGTANSVGHLRAALNTTSIAVGDIHAEILISAVSQGIGTVVGDIKGVFKIAGSTAGTVSILAFANFLGRLRANILGIASVSGLMWGKATGKGTPVGCNSLPLLYITDGSIKLNGQLNILNFLSEGSGFRLKNWRPQVTQYKEGGRFSNGPLAQGRRLRYRNFDNAIEVFELSAVDRDQDALISYLHELMSFQEAAADYWVSDYVVNPIYLTARSARETQTRYAVIHMISIGELENPYMQPFYNIKHAAFDTLTVRIERGHWLSTPPGKFECVPVSSVRSWTVSGWETGS